ncbi:MAG TPA: endonuclease/exonuclease/phosphatase family protein [Kofleriaceae bacterium]|nr:endonuclease/exonuclease/phosphatase family protein [Kofleriaceae bacterium]
MRLAVLLLVAAACEAPPDGGWNGEPVTARVMTLNVAGGRTLVDDLRRGENLADLLAGAGADVIALQECAPCDELAALLPPELALVAPADDGVALLHDAARWDVLDTDLVTLGDGDDGWGPRHARRARLEHRATGFVIDAYSTHYCVTIRRPDDACTVERQLHYTEQLLGEIAARHPPAVLAGDLNVFDGFARGRVIARLRSAGLTDALAAAHPDTADDAVTFHGNSWAPPGRVDYIFTPADVVVLDAAIDDSLPPGDGSDHDAVAADLLLGAAR